MLVGWHTRAERGKLKHLVIGDLIHLVRARHQPRVCGINAVHISIDLAKVGVERRSQRNRARVRAAPAQRGDVVIPVDPLETRYDYDVAFGKLVVDPLLVDPADTGRAVGRVGQETCLPAGQ